MNQLITACLLTWLAPALPAARAAADPIVPGSFQRIEDGPLRQRIETLVAGATAPEKAPEVARRLHEIGPDALPDMLSALGHRRIDDPRRSALLGALTLHGRAAVLPHLATTGQDAPTARAGSIVALGGLGVPADLERMLVLAADPADEGELHPIVHDALVQGATLLWSRHAPTTTLLRDAIRSQPTEVACPLVQAVASVPGEAGLGAFENLLGRRASVDRAIVPRLPLLATAARRPLRSDTLTRLRSLLNDSDDELARSAAIALTQLDDLESVGHLIGLLHHREARVVDTAHWSLVRLTGLGHGAEPEPWESWYQEQAEWYATRAPEVLRMLDQPGAGQAAQALRELSVRPLFREELAPEVARVLNRPEPELRLMGCTTLRQLGSEGSNPLLVARLRDSDPRVVQVSHAALVDLTGLNLPPDAESWHDALEQLASSTTSANQR